MKGIPVLMYHAIEDSDHPAGGKDAGEQLYVLQVSQFREQMEYLRQEGFRTFLLEEFMNSNELPAKGVALTFDDGHESNYTLAFPILQEFGFKATFFITTDWIWKPYFMSGEQIKALDDAGMGIGSHGKTHHYLSDLADNEIQDELSESKVMLENIIDKKIRAISYPGGRQNKITDNIVVHSGYDIVCCSRPAKYLTIGSHASIPRFSIKSKMSIAAFSSMVSSDISLLNNLKYKILSAAKLILGNRLYDFTRNILMR